MARMEKYSEEDKKRVVKKCLLLAVLLIVFVINLWAVAQERMEQKKFLEEYKQQMQTESGRQEDITQ